MTASKYTSSGLNGVCRSRSYASTCARLSSTAAGSVIVLRKTWLAGNATTTRAGLAPPPFAARRQRFDRGAPRRSRPRPGPRTAGCGPPPCRQDGCWRPPGTQSTAASVVERQHRPHAPAPHRVAQSGRDQRRELAHPPAPEGGEAERGATRRATAARDQGLPVPFSCADVPVADGGSDVGSGRTLLPKQSDKRTPRIVQRPQHGVAGEGYTIGRRRPDMDPPYRRGADGKPLRRRERRHRQPVRERFAARGDEGVDLLGRDARQREQHVAGGRRRVDAALPRIDRERCRRASPSAAG